jgi:hypothetical protein
METTLAWLRATPRSPNDATSSAECDETQERASFDGEEMRQTVLQVGTFGKIGDSRGSR